MEVISALKHLCMLWIMAVVWAWWGAARTCWGGHSLCSLPVTALSYDGCCNLRFVDPVALRCDWGQLQPRRSEENIFTTLARNSALASLLVAEFKTSARLPVFMISHLLCSVRFFCRANLVLLLIHFWKPSTRSLLEEGWDNTCSQEKIVRSANSEAENPYNFWSTRAVYFWKFLHTLPACFILCSRMPSSASYVCVSKHSEVLQPPALSAYLKIYSAINHPDEIHDEILSFTEIR